MKQNYQPIPSVQAPIRVERRKKSEPDPEVEAYCAKVWPKTSAPGILDQLKAAVAPIATGYEKLVFKDTSDMGLGEFISEDLQTKMTPPTTPSSAVRTPPASQSDTDIRLEANHPDWLDEPEPKDKPPIDSWESLAPPPPISLVPTPPPTPPTLSVASPKEDLKMPLLPTPSVTSKVPWASKTVKVREPLKKMKHAGSAADTHTKEEKRKRVFPMATQAPRLVNTQPVATAPTQPAPILAPVAPAAAAPAMVVPVIAPVVSAALPLPVAPKPSTPTGQNAVVPPGAAPKPPPPVPTWIGGAPVVYTIAEVVEQEGTVFEGYPVYNPRSGMSILKGYRKYVKSQRPLIKTASETTVVETTRVIQGPTDPKVQDPRSINYSHVEVDTRDLVLKELVVDNVKPWWNRLYAWVVLICVTSAIGLAVLLTDALAGWKISLIMTGSGGALVTAYLLLALLVMYLLSDRRTSRTFRYCPNLLSAVMCEVRFDQKTLEASGRQAILRCSAALPIPARDVKVQHDTYEIASFILAHKEYFQLGAL